MAADRILHHEETVTIDRHIGVEASAADSAGVEERPDRAGHHSRTDLHPGNAAWRLEGLTVRILEIGPCGFVTKCIRIRDIVTYHVQFSLELLDAADT